MANGICWAVVVMSVCSMLVGLGLPSHGREQE